MIQEAVLKHREAFEKAKKFPLSPDKEVLQMIEEIRRQRIQINQFLLSAEATTFPDNAVNAIADNKQRRGVK